MAEQRCFGAEDVGGEPICDGPDIRHVQVDLPWDGFETYWCRDCRELAIKRDAAHITFLD
jgi:hypothetical protein